MWNLKYVNHICLDVYVIWLLFDIDNFDIMSWNITVFRICEIWNMWIIDVYVIWLWFDIDNFDIISWNITVF